MVDEHLFMNLVSLNKKKFNPHLRFGKIVCVSGISTACTKQDNQCSYYRSYHLPTKVCIV